MKEYIERASVHSIIERTSTFAFTRGGMHDKVNSLPTADVAPVEHGHWNDINPAVLKPGISWVCRCSLCGCPQDYKHNYCPNCGARMDGKEGNT